jgi:hypothetical protein
LAATRILIYRTQRKEGNVRMEGGRATYKAGPSSKIHDVTSLPATTVMPGPIPQSLLSVPGGQFML